MTEIFPINSLTQSSASTAIRPTSVPESIRGGVITIGNFDGVHRGHASLLRHVRDLASEKEVPAVAVVLDPHPATILRPNQGPLRLTSVERRAELMDEHGIDALVVCNTTTEFLKLTAEQFFRFLVLDRLKASAMVEGPNFFFGRDRGGDIGVLQELCGEHGIGLTILAGSEVGGQMISSTRIRLLLEQGNVDEAARLLGWPHQICGRVVEGERRGRELGFPTANLAEIDVVLPSTGVYGGIATLSDTRDPNSGSASEYAAAIHIGPNPTFDDDGGQKVEVHLLGYDGDLYDQTLQVDLVTRVRDIARFDSVDQLVKQLGQDIQTIRSQMVDFRGPRN